MDEKKKIKVPLSLAIVFFVIMLILIVISCICIYKVINKKDNVSSKYYAQNTQNNYDFDNSDDEKEKCKLDYEEVTIDGLRKYQRLTSNTWSGDYHKDIYYTAVSNNTKEVVSYEDYLNYIEMLNENSYKVNDDENEKISNFYDNENLNYIILSYTTGGSFCDMDLIDCIEDDDKVIIYGQESIDGIMADGSGYFIVIPTKMSVGTEIDYRECIEKKKINLNLIYNPSESVDKKPIIYLYPKEEKEVTVKLGKPKSATCLYPEYDFEKGWNVIAKPNGELVNLNTNRKLYALYYEAENNYKFNVKNDGFVIKGEDSAKFLEEKLAILGLNEREAEEFIVYWLPELQKNKYNYIRFATMDEIEKNMPLEISSTPDTLIRILMTYKGLDAPIKIEEQKLQEVNREGFTVVEWGGTQIM